MSANQRYALLFVGNSVTQFNPLLFPMTSVKGDDNDEEEVVGSGNEEGEGDGEGERAMGKEVST